ncbi:MAG: transaldolase [Candidatus Omnitrophota bacterium]|nr:transaldolase [Candidatus Omnitrophota bacterium]
MFKRKYFKIKIFADGADVGAMKRVHKEGTVQGFTTNPTLMRKAGVDDYELFARSVLREIKDLPISFEVFSDEFEQMEKDARKIAKWGANVNVKIPVTNTNGESSRALIKKLSAEGIPLNVTAILTVEQVEDVIAVLSKKTPSIISVFAGRIADTGRDPVVYMKKAAAIVKNNPCASLLWASSRELLNIFQAESAGCHIITVTDEILKKIILIEKDLMDLSLDTVKMFYKDAQLAGYKI